MFQLWILEYWWWIYTQKESLFGKKGTLSLQFYSHFYEQLGREQTVESLMSEIVAKICLWYFDNYGREGRITFSPLESLHLYERLKFTIKEKNDSTLTFLVMKLTRRDENIVLNIFRKPLNRRLIMLSTRF